MRMVVSTQALHFSATGVIKETASRSMRDNALAELPRQSLSYHWRRLGEAAGVPCRWRLTGDGGEANARGDLLCVISWLTAES